MINDNVKITGDLTIRVFGPDDQEKDSREIKNMVVSSGKTLIAKILSNNAALPSHFGLGTGTTPPTAEDTTLQTAAGARIAFNSSSFEDNVVTYIASIMPGTATGSYTEAGIFNALTSGTMLARTSFNTITKTSVDKMVITWNIRVN